MIELWDGYGEGGPRHGSPPMSAGKGGERAGARILVVDDDTSILDTVTAILVAEGYQVMAAGGGEEALALVRSWHPTLVLLDMRMPVMDGWGFARAIAAQGLHLPTLVITAAQDAGRWAEEIGAQGFLAKPFELMDLLETVERLCAAH